MDSIWFLRNKVVHEAFKPNLQIFISQTSKVYKEHCEAWGNKMINTIHNWKVVPKDHQILTFDVAVRTTGSTAAAVCRKDDGEIIFVHTRFIHSTNPNQGDATALLIGLQEAKEKNIENLVTAGDSLNTLLAAKDADYNPDWLAQPIIQDIKNLMITLKS